MAETYDLIVVGGGINGLTTAAYLAKAGKKVLVIERRWETGGAVMTDEESGCRINTHAIYMMMMDVAPAYADLKLSEFGCTYITPQPAAALLLGDGRALCLYNDVEKSVASIAAFSKKDAETFRKVYLKFKEMCDDCLVPQTYRLAMAPLDLVTLMNRLPLGEEILEISEKTPREIIEGCGFETEPLKALLLYLTSMWGIDPEVSGVGYLVPLYIYRMLNASLIRGGSHRLSSAIVKSLVADKGEVEETTEVERLIIENGRAAGVVTTDGREFRAKAVVSTVDPQQSFLRFVGKEKLGTLAPGLADAVEGWQWENTSHYMLHLITDTEPAFAAEGACPDAGRALIQVMGVETLADVVANFDTAKAGGLPNCAHITNVTRFDKSQGPSIIAKYYPEFLVSPKHMHALRLETICPFELAKGDWETAKDTFAATLRDLLNRYAPNMKDGRIIREYAYPPTYIEMKFPNMRRGSIKHGEYQSTQMGYFRPNDLCSQYGTPIPGYFVGGASVYPGGMVLLGSGYGAAYAVANDLEVSPWWKTPEYIEKAIKKGLVA